MFSIVFNKKDLRRKDEVDKGLIDCVPFTWAWSFLSISGWLSLKLVRRYHYNNRRLIIMDSDIKAISAHESDGIPHLPI